MHELVGARLARPRDLARSGRARRRSSCFDAPGEEHAALAPLRVGRGFRFSFAYTVDDLETLRDWRSAGTVPERGGLSVNVLITGGGSGIGAACARALRQRGATAWRSTGAAPRRSTALAARDRRGRDLPATAATRRRPSRSSRRARRRAGRPRLRRPQRRGLALRAPCSNRRPRAGAR